MKFHHIVMVAALGCSLSSCFKEEPANAECDIEAAWIHTDNPLDMFYNVTDTLQRVLYTDNLITFDVKPGVDITSLAPMFKITPGATIVPASGSVQDFSNGAVHYKVTSEDGEWSRDYYVFFNIATPPTDTIRFSFEDYYINPYYIWNDSRYRWDTGNAGYNLTGMANELDENGNLYTIPDKFPSIPADGYSGRGVKLTTKDTGFFGLTKGMRIAAGNLFIGSFDASVAMRDARSATLFGQPYTGTKQPYKIRGYYKFERGASYQDENGNIDDSKQDEADIYAVFYRNHDEAGNVVTLDGDDVKTSQYIVGMAQVTDIVPTDEWTQFEAEFDFSSAIDRTLLSNRGYSLAIVFSSSVEGAYFRGAIGSTLMIDEVEFISTDIQE